MRRFGDTPEPGIKYRDRIGVYAVIQHKDQILLTEEGHPNYEIQLPGGGVDPGESPIQALHREVLEETGWRIADPIRIGSYKRYVYMPEYDLHARKICLIYLAQAVRRLGPPLEEHHIPLFADFGIAPDLPASEGDRYFLGRALGVQG